MNPIYDQTVRARGFDPMLDKDRPMREFIAWWWSKGSLTH